MIYYTSTSLSCHNILVWSSQTFFLGKVLFFFSQPDGQWGTGIGKKYTGSIFFAKASSAGLTNYVIRHNSQKGNMTSLPWVFGQRRITSLTNSFGLCPFKDYYTINMILMMCKSLILLMYVDSSMKDKFIHTCSDNIIAMKLNELSKASMFIILNMVNFNNNCPV